MYKIKYMKYFNDFRIIKRDKYSYSFKGQLIKFIVIFGFILIIVLKYLK